MKKKLLSGKRNKAFFCLDFPGKRQKDKKEAHFVLDKDLDVLSKLLLRVQNQRNIVRSR